MLKVKVNSVEVSVRSGVARVSGKPYTMRNQEECIVELPDGEVRRFSIMLNEKQEAWAVGNYLLDAGTLLTVNQYGNIGLKPFAHIELKTLSGDKTALFNKVA